MVKLLGISKVASQYIGEARGGEGANLIEFCFQIIDNISLIWSSDCSLSEGFPCLPGPLVIQHIQEGCQQEVRACCISLPWFGCIYLICWKWLLSLNSRFGSDVSLWLAAITLSQFHFLFYSSRPLPNIMVINQPLLLCSFFNFMQALVPVLLCLSCWLRDLHTGFLLTASFAILVFRSLRILMCLGLSATNWSLRFSLIGSFLSKCFHFVGANWHSFWDSFFWWSFLLGEYLSKGAHTNTHTFLHWSR